jgi:hypothetical protein
MFIVYTSGRLRERETMAVSQEREMALLNRLTGRLIAIHSSLEMAETLCTAIEGVFHRNSFVFTFWELMGNVLSFSV